MSGYIGTQPVPQATQTRDSFTATSGQTSFATGGYTPNFLDVYLNGVKLASGASADYTATNGSDVVLASGASTGDILEVVAYTAFDTANVTGATDFTVTGAFTSQGIDDNANATALTIDSSENVLVANTTPVIFTSSSITGHNIAASGSVQHNTDGETTMYLNRLTSDGTILDFRKDGTAVGSIGTQGSRLSIGSGDVNLNFNASANSMYPISDPAAGTLSDGVIDVGAATGRFKDLYLSGGVYLGGTGSANKLTDYEQGTWTPVDSNGNAYNQAVTATYVKIGKLVYIYCDITDNSNTSGTQIAGLPFTTGTSSNAGTISQGYYTGTGTITGHMYGSSIYMINGESTSKVLAGRLMLTGHYHTDA